VKDGYLFSHPDGFSIGMSIYIVSIGMISHGRLSIGRIANIDDLHLERLGIDLDSRGIPPFDEKTMQFEDLPFSSPEMSTIIVRY
jgi:hypothetical protein